MNTKMKNSDLVQRLFKAFRLRQVECFRKLLSQGSNPDGRCPKTAATILCTACHDPARTEFVRALLNAGADPNLDQPGLVAARQENFIALAMLLECPAFDINSHFENQSNILHYLCWAPCKVLNSEKLLRCISEVLSRPDVLVNKPDAFGMTPIMYAAEMYYEDRVQVMLKQSKHRLYLDALQPMLGKTIREFILKRFVDLKGYLPPPTMECLDSPDFNVRLLAALQHKQLGIFSNILKQRDSEGTPIVDPNYCHGDPYYCTCLELACRMEGCEEYVKVLLQAGADPTSLSQLDDTPLIHFVLDNCNIATLKVIIEDGRVDISKLGYMNTSPLHVVAMQRRDSVEDNERCRQCIELLLNMQRRPTLDAPPQPCFDINAVDTGGNTALHYAAQYGTNEVTLTLLRRGANLMVKNKCRQPPLPYIPAPVLETFLDEQLESNEYSSRSGLYTLVFKYGFLQSLPCCGPTTEMEPLLHMSEPHLRHLLQHPVISSYIYLKWTRLRVYFYINLTFYTIFVIVLTSYITVNESENRFINSTEVVTPIVKKYVIDNISAAANSQDTNLFEERVQKDNFKVWTFLVILLCFLIVNEIFQMFMLRLQYLRSAANFMNLLVIAVSSVVVGHAWIDDAIFKHLCAIAILISWVELVLLSGRLPSYSIHLEMLKKVTATFLTFMIWYFLLILAFAFCFHVLFYKFREEEDLSSENFFTDPAISLVKTVAMFSGEFGFSSLPFMIAPGTSHVVFVVFVFLIAIVLLNLMNGLAVYDTQAIKENARVLSLVSLVRLVASIERTMLDIKTSTITTHTRMIKFMPDPRLFPENNCSVRKQIQVFPNEKGKVKFYMDTDNTRRFKRFRMNELVIKGATSIILKRQYVSDMEKISSMFDKLNRRLDYVENCVEGHKDCYTA